MKMTLEQLGVKKAEAVSLLNSLKADGQHGPNTHKLIVKVEAQLEAITDKETELMLKGDDDGSEDARVT